MYGDSSPFTSVCSQVKDSLAPRASSVSPEGWMLEQWASVRDVKCSATFPVFSTVILYSTVWPTLPVNLAVV